MSDQWYTAEELAELLKLSPQTTRAWIREKKIKAVRFGRSWRISKAEMERLLQEGVNDESKEDSGSALLTMRRHQTAW